MKKIKIVLKECHFYPPTLVYYEIHSYRRISKTISENPKTKSSSLE